MAKQTVVEVCFRDQVQHVNSVQWSAAHRNSYVEAHYDTDTGILTLEPDPKANKPRLRIHITNIKHMVYGLTQANRPDATVPVMKRPA